MFASYIGRNSDALHNNLGDVYRARRRNSLGGLRTPLKLLRRSCKNAQNAHRNENRGEAVAEGRRSPLFSLLMEFGHSCMSGAII